MLQRIFGFFTCKKVSEWFTVTFDADQVTLYATPPGRAPWQQSFHWVDVTRVCFKGEGLSASDGIYIFTSKRPESYVIPTEAKGGVELWNAVVQRGLFPHALAVKAATTPKGMFCWPP
jgi:hypothetical protein